MLLQPDNVIPHNSAVVWQYRISDVKLAALKKHLKEINFTCHEAVPPATGKWFQEQPEEFYSVRFKNLVQCCQHYTKQETDY
jgi:hypothetical protein